MSLDQSSSQDATWVSTGDFQRALEEIDMEEVRRSLEIDEFLVNQPLDWDWDCYNPPCSPLVYAVYERDRFDSGRSVLELVELVRLLLDHKADINAEDTLGRTALHFAVEYNLVQVVELLLQYQAQVDARSYRGHGGRTPLFTAKSVEVARLLIAHGAEVNSKDGWGRTPLFSPENVEIAQLLIAHGADVNSKDDYGRTPLFSPENVEMAQLLIANGADVNSKDDYGHPAWLSAMTEFWDLETLRVFMGHGADLQATWGEDGMFALHLAAQDGTLEIMEFLLDQGVPVNGKATVGGGTPLHYAVRQGTPQRTQRPWLTESRWVRGVQLLLQRGADVNATDRGGKTPFAYINAFPETDATKVAELLIENGAVIEHGKDVLLRYVHPRPCRSMLEFVINHQKIDLNTRDSADSDTWAFDMIDKLCKNENVYRQILMLLIEFGADVNVKHRQSGRTLLHFAATGYNLMQPCYNKEEFDSEVQLLLEKGSDVNAIDKNGFTPLLYALYCGHWKIVRILVDHGADVNIAHKDHGTPLSMAYTRNEESTMQLLLDAGAQVDERSKDGATTLLVCVGKGLVGCASLLVNRGADIHAANEKGCTPFLAACTQSGLDLIYCLLRLSSHHGRLGLLSEVSYPSCQ